MEGENVINSKEQCAGMGGLTCNNARALQTFYEKERQKALL
jgi:hypothetical protein